MATISRWAINLMFPAALIPISSWFIAQGFTARITRNDEWTGALVHTLDVDVFAVILAASMLINATIANVRRPITPLTFRRFRKLPLWVLIVLVLSLVWFAALTASPSETSTVEQITGIGLAGSSIVTCVYASKLDRDSITLRQLRRNARAARLDAIPAATRTRRRRIRLAIVIPVATIVVLSAAGTVTVAQTTTVRYADCSVDGLSEFGQGQINVDTDGCGSFEIDGGTALYNQLSRTMDRSDFTIISRGWAFGLPLRRHATSVTTN